MPDVKLLLSAAGLALACLAVAALLKPKRGAGPMLAQSRALPRMKGSLDATARGRGVSVEIGREIPGMLEAGRRQEAVALVRERTGWNREEAEAALSKLDNLRKRLES